MPGSATNPRLRDRLLAAVGERLAPLSGIVPYLGSIALVVLAALASALSSRLASAPSLTLFFLLAVVFSARRYGLWPAVLTSVLGVLCWDYYFTVPYYSLSMSDPADLFALVAFFAVALIISGMTAQIRRQNAELATLANSLSDLYGLSQEFSQKATVDALAAFTVSRLSEMLNCIAVVVLRDHADDSVRLVFPVDRALTAEELAAADGVFFELAAANRLDRGPGGRYAFLPLNALHGRIGSVGLSRPDQPVLSGEERLKLEAILSHAALATERAWLARDIEHAQMSADNERLRNALLTSVSHDLRTPLTTIIGALSTLTAVGASFSASIRNELVSTARNEAERLNRFVGNLLDITKLESGSLTAHLEPTDLGEVVEMALERAQPLMGARTIEVSLPSDVPLVKADFAMLEQVFFNLLDNAAKYSPPRSTIAIRGTYLGDGVTVEILDEGQGIPEDVGKALFQKFARFAQGDSTAPGTGLGLMICKGFLEIMGGSIVASNRRDRQGAQFAIRLKRAP